MKGGGGVVILIGCGGIIAIHDTFELCADVVVTKLQSYYQQADDYHNQCLQGEFRAD